MELERVGLTFRHDERAWETLAATTDWGARKPPRLARGGLKAYAAKQAAMFRSLAADAEEKLQRVTKRYAPLDLDG